MSIRKREVCKKFTAFQHAMEICDNCGNPAEQHAGAPEPTNLDKALWKVLLDIGGTWNYYGGCFDPAYKNGSYTTGMFEIQKHMKRCAIDWRTTRKPEMDDRLAVFDGTFAEGDSYKSGLMGRLTCKCRTIFSTEIGTTELTLGQLIWQAVHADD